MLELDGQKPNGILRPGAIEREFRLARHQPAPDLAYFVQRYWVVRWDLRGRPPYLQETLPFPCVNLAIQRGRSGVFGVVSGRFAARLEGQGWVFGVKFRPGAFFPFLGAPVTQITDRVIELDALFGAAGRALERDVLAQTDERHMIALVERFLRVRLPEPDGQIELINQIVDRIVADRAITRVDHLAGPFGLSQRTLQRMFSQYVGVGPKWVIKRYRLQEAADRIASAGSCDSARLAADLGYFDQAHFIKDFKSIVGKSPSEYASEAGAARAQPAVISEIL
jgi:AraC-like DNA-binding protein